VRFSARRYPRRAGAALATMAVVWVAGWPAQAPAAPPPSGAITARAAPGPYATLLFSRTEITAADNCVVNNTNIARLDTTVAPYLRSLGLQATGTLVTDKTKPNALTCTHSRSSMTASWTQATKLASNYSWSFVSHTATYPSNLAGLTATQSEAETCGSAETIDSHGLPGGHGLIAYPGAQSLPVDLQTNYASTCFAWGRKYGSAGTTAASAGQTSPYWQNTVALNGGPCNVSTAACYTIPATGSQRYQLPSKYVGYINAIGPGEWFTLQAYILVTGTNPIYASSPVRWDCTSSNPRLHWTNDNERYCLQDWKTVVQAMRGIPSVTVTDPLTVGIAFGRPASYP
jgi:hypothetical protein